MQKYGGTSVATPESREFVYGKILAARKEGFSLVVVISAMGRTGAPYATDTLLDLLRLDQSGAEKREQDLIFSCGEIISGTLVTTGLQSRRQKAIFLTGQQAGIITTPEFSDARILEAETTRIRTLLAEGHIVVVGGGQGATREGEITTLGRGGSDTTACTLGVALDAERIEIYTDVDGIYTTDPRIVPEARLLDQISYEECSEMAYQGAKVMHPRAVEIASQKPAIELFVRSTFTDSRGTLICDSRRQLPDGADLPGRGEAVGVALMRRQGILKAEGLDGSRKAAILRALSELRLMAMDIHPEEDHLTLVMEDQAVAGIREVLGRMGLEGRWLTGLNKISVILDAVQPAPELYGDFLERIEGLGVTVEAAIAHGRVMSAWIQDEAEEAIRAVHGLVGVKSPA